MCVCVCERERERGRRQKKEKTGGIVDKKEICHSGRKKKKKKTGSRQETWKLNTEPQLKRLSCVRLK